MFGQSKKSLAVLKLEALAFLMLAASFTAIALSTLIAGAIELLLAVVFLFVLFAEARKLFGKDFRPIAIFFVFLMALILASFLVQLASAKEISLRFQLFLALAAAAFVFFIVFKIFFTRTIVSGKVISAENGSALVETGFDFLAGIQGGKYSVKAHGRHSKGETVKIKISQGAFGRKPSEIMK